MCTVRHDGTILLYDYLHRLTVAIPNPTSAKRGGRGGAGRADQWRWGGRVEKNLELNLQDLKSFRRNLHVFEI